MLLLIFSVTMEFSTTHNYYEVNILNDSFDSFDSFDSDFCKVQRIAEDGVVLLTWKKYAHHDDYREPTLFALELLRTSGDNIFVIDARDRFEDHEDDIVWAFNALLPAMATTDLRHVAFIMNDASEIEGEMDLWTREFRKYFTVDRATDYDGALAKVPKGFL